MEGLLLFGNLTPLSPEPKMIPRHTHTLTLPRDLNSKPPEIKSQCRQRNGNRHFYGCYQLNPKPYTLNTEFGNEGMVDRLGLQSRLDMK